MDIVCNIDNHYVKYCIVTLVSLFQNNQQENIRVHIIADNLSQIAKQLMHEELDRFGNELIFHDAGHQIIANCPISDECHHISIATYYRIFLPVILPESISKVLYLDCDLIVESSVSELWNTNVEGYALAATEDWRAEVEEFYKRLHYEKKYSYFNAGVLLINLDYWRKHHLMEACVRYIQSYPERLTYNDQDVLNGVLYAQWLHLPYQWNMHYYLRKTTMSEKALKEIETTLFTPAILHYITDVKPWNLHCYHPLAHRWFHYLDQTRWKGERPKKTLKDFFNYYIKPIGYLIGIDKPRYKKLHK